MKFRVWDSFNKCYLETEDGLWFKEVLLEEDGFNLSQSINLSEVLCEPTEGERQYFAEIYTGQLDKNGKEIYIGDIVEHTIPIGRGPQSFTVEKFVFPYELQANQSVKLKIIGNIHGI